MDAPAGGAGAAPTPSSSSSSAARTVIWDLDGTLVDTETIATEVINSILGRYGVRCDPTMKREIVGTRRDFWTTHLLVRTGIVGQISPDDLGREWEEQCAIRMPTAALMPGVESLTRALQERGTVQAIATSSTRPMTKLGPHPSVAARMALVVSGDMVQRGKPAPDIFLLAAERLGVPPGQCVVLEDSPLGVQGAKAAGMIAVAVPDPGVGLPPEEFWAAGADAVFPTLDGVDVATLLAVVAKSGGGGR
jgi:HAD superfamily hydrolase (TIGR01509 family)